MDKLQEMEKRFQKDINHLQNQLDRINMSLSMGQCAKEFKRKLCFVLWQKILHDDRWITIRQQRRLTWNDVICWNGKKYVINEKLYPLVVDVFLENGLSHDNDTLQIVCNAGRYHNCSHEDAFIWKNIRNFLDAN